MACANASAVLRSALGGEAVKGIITVQHAAEALHVTPARVRQMVDEGKLKAEKLGKFWLIEPRSLKREMEKRTQREEGAKA
jgi:excisionase family DNA binding protein